MESERSGDHDDLRRRRRACVVVRATTFRIRSELTKMKIQPNERSIQTILRKRCVEISCASRSSKSQLSFASRRRGRFTHLVSIRKLSTRTENVRTERSRFLYQSNVEMSSSSQSTRRRRSESLVDGFFRSAFEIESLTTLQLPSFLSAQLPQRRSRQLPETSSSPRTSVS